MAPSGGRARPWLRVGISLLLAAGLLAAVRPVMSAMPERPMIAPTALLGYIAALVPFHVLRSGRWWLLLRSLAPISRAEALALGLAGYWWIAALPLRLGELARPLLLARKTGIPLGQGLAAVAIERIVDGLAVGLLFFASAWATQIEHPMLFRAVTLTMAAFASALVVLLTLTLAPQSIHGPLRRLWLRLPFGLGARVARLLDELRLGRSLVRPGTIAPFIGVTTAYWLWNVSALTWLAHGCGLGLSWSQAALVTAAMNLVLIFPGGPGQLGIFQGGMALGLSLVVDPQTLASEGSRLTFWLYLCQLGTVTVAGLAAHRWLGIPWHDALGTTQAPVSDNPR